MPSVTIYHDDGTTETIGQTVGYSHKRTIGEQYKLKIHVARSAAQAVSLERKADEVELTGVRRGVLTDIQKGGASWTLVVRSPEWYATTQAPTLGGDRREGDDNALLTSLINDVPQWSVGSIADLTGPMTFVFNHAFANEAMRRIEKNVPGELQWSGDGTVDYVARLGSDKTGSITLSPTAGNLDGDIKVQERSREFDSTHLRIIGAHEGEAQKFATLVPSDDSATYENRVNYTTSRWSDGDTRDWARRENKDVMSQDTIEEEAAALGEELADEYIEVKATVVGEDLALGDSVQVTKPEADIDREMRVHRITTRTKDGEDTAAVVDDVLLSTRTIMRDETNANQRDIQRFNTAFQGSSVVVQGGGSRQPVNGSLNAEIPFDYPVLEFEHEAVLQVRGLPYRAYSSGAASGGTTTSNDNTSYGKVTDASSGDEFVAQENNWQIVDRFQPSSPSSSAVVTTSVNTPSQNIYSIRAVSTEDFVDVPSSSGATIVSANGATNQVDNATTLVVPGDHNGEIVDLEIKFGPGADETKDAVVNVTWYTIGPHQHTLDEHTHAVDPGIINFPGETPSNCDVVVNGTTVATDIGSGTFETEVDISGELSKDSWNDIEVTSDTLGHIQATVSIDGYKQIGQN